MAITAVTAADPVVELESFSRIENVDLSKLVDGEIAAQRGALMEFPRGLSVEACFVVKRTPAETMEQMRTWDASPHEDLKLYFHKAIQSPAKMEDFQEMKLERALPAFRWLVEKTAAISSDRNALQISRKDLTKASEWLGKGRAPAEGAAQFWKKLLLTKTIDFQEKGLKGDFTYDFENEPIWVENELQSLLAESPVVEKRFHSFLSQTPLVKGAPFPAASYDWELLDISGHAAFNLGAFYMKEIEPGHYQGLDCTYYSSSGIYASFTLIEVWPVQIAGAPASLVWEEDVVSAPSLATVHGVERMASGKVMLQEFKESLRYFCEDIQKHQGIP